MKRAEQMGTTASGGRIGTQILRHSYVRHYLLTSVPINHLSRWPGHSSIQTTLLYPELVSDPTGSMAVIP